LMLPPDEQSLPALKSWELAVKCQNRRIESEP
jgi:hypothetical protein